ncbi:MAG: hypothetical protein EXQ59_00865 [Acidobacteria bacterium]|nr:hypothetical protein [Acidobacteriota bacterium]
MKIRRVLILSIALAWVGVMSPTLFAQGAPNVKRDQPKRTKQEQQDIEALVKLADGVTAGTLPAQSDLPVAWESNHFARSANGTTYVPFTLSVDRSKLAAPAVAMYVRVISKDPAPVPAAPAAASQERSRSDQLERVTFPWEDIFFVPVPADGRTQRAMAVKPGNYEVLVFAKERTPEKEQKNAPPRKVGVLRRTVTVPDYSTPDLQTSSLIIASSIEPVTTQLTPTQQQEQPYNFGALKIVPSLDMKVKKSGELQLIFWVYGAGNTAGKPNIVIDYSFHQKTGDTEKYFNKTAPQELSAQTLPPEFDTNIGHQLTGSLVLPVSSFPEGDYRLEIKVTDKVSGKTLTQNANFAVVAG